MDTLNGQKTIELIVYLASLVSEPHAIGAMLDPMRQITAKMGPDKTIQPSDQKTLDQVCDQLKRYLTTQEKLRSFTSEQLQERIIDFTHGTQHRSMRETLTIATAITTMLILAVVFFPFPLTADARGLTAASIFFMMVHLTAAWYFVGALRSFAPTLRQAYLFIAGGVVILGLTQIVQPIVNVMGLQSTPYNTLFSVVPLIPSYMLIYEGARRFAKLQNRQAWWLQPWTVVLVLFITTPLSLVIPYGDSLATKSLLEAIFSLQIINITIVVALTALLARILGSLTTLYARPVRLLLAFAIVSIGIGMYMLGVNALTGGVPSQIMLIPLIMAISVNGFILLRAGYAFNRASMQ